MKMTVNWLVFSSGIIYGVALIPKLSGTIFVLGSHDTLLEVLGILAYGLVPIPASLIAIRWRKVAALCFVLAGALWIAGVISSQLHLQKLGFDAGWSYINLAKGTGLLLAFALFYLFTEFARWPLLRNPFRA